MNGRIGQKFSKDPGTADLVRFFLEKIQGPMNGRIGQKVSKGIQNPRTPRFGPIFLKGDSGIHKRPNRSKSFQGNTESRYRRFCPIFLKKIQGSTNLRIGLIFREDTGIRGPSYDP